MGYGVALAGLGYYNFPKTPSPSAGGSSSTSPGAGASAALPAGTVLVPLQYFVVLVSVKKKN